MTNASGKKREGSVSASRDVAPQDELPKHLREPPTEHWQWPTPIAWLLGVKLLGSLRDMLLSSVAKVDIRTWMTAGEMIDLTKDHAKIDGEDCCYIDFLADTGDSQQMVYQLAQLLLQPTLRVESSSPTSTPKCGRSRSRLRSTRARQPCARCSAGPRST